MGRSQSVKFQIQLMEKYVQLMEKMLANGEKLNKGQIQAINNNAKEFRRYALKETQEKNSLKKAMDKNKLSREEFKVRKDLKSADESLVRLRSALRMQEEREHGAQVRRNIVLRDKQESFHNALSFTKNALTGGFGFSDALGRVVKSAATTTKQFNEIRRSSLSLSDAQKKYRKSLTDVSIAQMAGGSSPDASHKKYIKIAEDARDVAKMDMMSRFDVATQNQLGGGAAENKHTKPIFEKLSKLGEFLSKKAVPIGIGLGVAGVLISVIVKAFSASPLFAAMMKLMKFMVTLILMPIGTFFGALLRPILIMLLRKFIVPMYSSWMPTAISLGTQLGEWMTSWSWEGFEEAVKSLNPLYNPDGDKNKGDTLPIDPDTGEPQPPNKADPTRTDNDFLPPEGSPPYEHEVVKEAEEEAKRSADWWETHVYKPLNDFGHWLDGIGFPRVYGEQQIPPYAGSLEHVLEKMDENGATGKNSSDSYDSNEHMYTWGGSGHFNSKDEYMNPVIGNAESVLTENQKMIQKYIKNPDLIAQEQNFRKAQEDEEKRLKQEENQKRISESLKKPNIRNIDQVIADQALRNAQQETINTSNPRFEGTPSEEKLSRSLNAGMDIGAKMAQNASKGHVNLSSSNKSNLKPETVALLKSMGVAGYAQGFDGMVNSPTLFMAGEAGAEHVKVTPSGQGGGGNITVNIQNMNGSDDDLRKLKKTILEVIQQSANNRGRI